ncbi:MAG: hypothetical protein JO249_00990 [Acidobacteria bacterium]|nr:hypothetical protein [Acidobacteriota bacterium]
MAERFWFDLASQTSLRIQLVFVQAFSADGGKTWEENFRVTETLVKDELSKSNDQRRLRVAA